MFGWIFSRNSERLLDSQQVLLEIQQAFLERQAVRLKTLSAEVSHLEQEVIKITNRLEHKIDAINHKNFVETVLNTNTDHLNVRIGTPQVVDKQDRSFLNLTESGDLRDLVDRSPTEESTQ